MRSNLFSPFVDSANPEPVSQHEALDHQVPHVPKEDELHQVKASVESLSGMSLDHVKVHDNSTQPAQLNALAYAQGGDIHLAPGQEKHLPHEAWHVVQQAQGRVKPTRQMKGGVAVNDDAGLEREADAMGAMAIGTILKKTKKRRTSKKSLSI